MHQRRNQTPDNGHRLLARWRALDSRPIHCRAQAPVVLAAVALAPRALGRALDRADRMLLTAVVAHRPHQWAPAARRATRVAEPPVVTGAVIGAATWSAHLGAPPRAITRILTTAATGIAARRGLARAINRPRPPAAWWWDKPTGPSYPSRHVVWADLGYGAARDLLRASGTHAMTADSLQRAATTLTAGTRVLLAVHWPSDVLAALSFAMAWRSLIGRNGEGPRRTPRRQCRSHLPGMRRINVLLSIRSCP
jgi:membrane-associated phospholipid phosphatase